MCTVRSISSTPRHHIPTITTIILTDQPIISNDVTHNIIQPTTLPHALLVISIWRYTLHATECITNTLHHRRHWLIHNAITNVTNIINIILRERWPNSTTSPRDAHKPRGPNSLVQRHLSALRTSFDDLSDSKPWPIARELRRRTAIEVQSKFRLCTGRFYRWLIRVSSESQPSTSRQEWQYQQSRLKLWLFFVVSIFERLYIFERVQQKGPLQRALP
jgi:hypothetical protein